MSELDDRQESILDAWKKGQVVTGFRKGEFGIQHAMMNAVTGPLAKEIAEGALVCDPEGAEPLTSGIRLVARELAASHMGYPYLPDAEAAMKIEKE